MNTQRFALSVALAGALTASIAMLTPVSAQAHDVDASAASTSSGTGAPRETITPAYQYALPNVPGKTITAIVVDYPPGGKSLPHRHGQSFVAAYVLQGAIRSQVDNGESRVYHAGESWSENPGAHHKVSDNASDTEPAKLLAVFIADTKQKDLVHWDEKKK